MTESNARRQRSEERRRRILDEARACADEDGWAAVTTRRLADAIGYTQPVLYGHFPGGKAEIIRAVAFEGFTELTELCRSATGGTRGRQAIEAVADAYLDFASAHPAVYEAMFRQPIDARFAEEGNEPELRAGFEALASAIGDEHGGTRTEVFWGSLHGISELERAGRMRGEHRANRIAELGILFGVTADAAVN
ncbi:TetR/AcrR family transcriptional regulator [Humibacter soli]